MLGECALLPEREIDLRLGLLAERVGSGVGHDADDFDRLGLVAVETGRLRPRGVPAAEIAPRESGVDHAPPPAHRRRPTAGRPRPSATRMFIAAK